MAVFFNGMSRDEAVALTLAMRDSGDVLDWSDLPGPVTDKHSTGGVGDNVSLMLAPIVAACGAYVPMISGRGLGHTGGTLDKMDSIPGYVSQPDNALFRKAVLAAGCAIIGQTADLAPADKRLYAIRDVTATVESVPLITASILSKKLAAGLESLVLDVKVGNGAFMAKIARRQRAGDEPRRGRQRRRPEDLRADHRHERAARLGRRQCRRGRQCGRLPDRPAARQAAARRDAGAGRRDAAVGRHCRIQSGRPAARQRCAGRRPGGGNLRPHGAALGGPADFVERSAAISAAGAGRAAGAGAARRLSSARSPRATSALPSSRSAAAARGPRMPSITRSASPRWRRSARRCAQGEPLAVVHARSDDAADAAAAAVRAAYRISETRPAGQKSVLRARSSRRDLKAFYCVSTSGAVGHLELVEPLQEAHADQVPSSALSSSTSACTLSM